MDKASGVYLTITDESTPTAGSTGLIGIVPMYTMKGSTTELNKVTASNYKDILGYDLSYNSNYYGLGKMLESVKYLLVYRMNVNPVIGNTYYSTQSSGLATVAQLTDIERLKALEYSWYVAQSFAGKTRNFAFEFKPIADSFTFANISGDYEMPSVATSVEIDKLNCSLTHTDGTLAAFRPTYKAETNVIEFHQKEVAPEKPETPDVVVATVYLAEAKLNLSTQLGVGDNLVLKYISSEYPNWRFVYYDKSEDSDPVYQQLGYVDFSTVASSDKHWSKVAWGDFEVDLTGLNSSISRDKIDLQSSSNGAEATASDLNTALLKKYSKSFLVTNGSYEAGIINSFINIFAPRQTMCLIDCPDYAKYDFVSSWRKSITASEYARLFWIPDIVNTSIRTIPVYPSVNAFLIYANMYATYGHLRFPPAGNTYGNVAVESLAETDWEDYQDELKTDRINYQKITPNGPVIWEQRTLYGSNTDLSYASSVIIIRDLSEILVAQLGPSNFRFTTPNQLVTLETALTSTLDSFVTDGFLSKYELKVPTYEEAQAAGRELNIDVGVYVTKDSEVINLRLVLKSA